MSNRTLCVTERIYKYMLSVSLRENELLQKLRRETEKDEKSSMQIAPEQGQFMAFLLHLIGARKALEIGVFTGYSSLCTAMALPEDGRLIACDINETWSRIARRYWEEAGVAHKIELRLAPAAQTLADLLAAGEAGTFDFAFIDADKANYDHYYEQCLKLLRPGGLVAVDNVFWGGDVAEPGVADRETEAIRALNEKILADDRVEMSLVPIADGLTLARKCPAQEIGIGIGRDS
jgi:predicted O-methyltransferase YrrM